MEVGGGFCPFTLVGLLSRGDYIRLCMICDVLRCAVSDLVFNYFML